MRSEAKEELESKNDLNRESDSSMCAFVSVNESIDVMGEIRDEVLQLEELTVHIEQFKVELIRCFTDIRTYMNLLQGKIRRTTKTLCLTLQVAPERGESA